MDDLTSINGERNLSVLDHLASLGPDEGHVALLSDSSEFGTFLRKDDLLAEGVAAFFGLADEAELLALSFHAKRFTPSEAATWLADRGFKPLLFVPT